MHDQKYYFDDYEVDRGRCALLRAGQQIDLRPKAFDVLCYLLNNPGRVVSKAELLEAVWPSTFVTDDALTHCIGNIRRALSDASQEIIKTVPRRGYLFAPKVSKPEPGPDETDRGSPPPSQEITFCQTSDGVNLAVASAGAGVPFIRTATWLNHLEYDWTNPIRADLCRFLAERFRFIRYDGRGMGLSDRELEEVTFATFVRDLETVIDSFRLRHCSILGISQGAATAIAYAVRQPDRVSRLILHGGYALGRNKRSAVSERETAEAYLTLMRHGWGDEHSAYLKALSAIYFPKGTSEEIGHFAELQRAATSVENAIKLRAACDDLDVVDLLAEVSVPTLVMHSRYDKVVPYEEGRRIAASIPNARLVTLETENHMPLPGEPAWLYFLREIEAFVAG